MIQRSDILSIPFLKKSPFTGSLGGMRYRLERLEREEGAAALLAQIWEGPYCFDAVDKEQKKGEEFSFDEEGICRCIDWLNDCFQKEEERWRRAAGKWDSFPPRAHKKR